MNNGMLNQIDAIIEQEFALRLRVKDAELEQANTAIQELQATVAKNGEWLVEKQALLEKIEQLEQYSSISLVRAYDAKVANQSKELKRLERDNEKLKTRLSKLEQELKVKSKPVSPLPPPLPSATNSNQLTSPPSPSPSPEPSSVSVVKTTQVSKPNPAEAEAEAEADDEVELHYIELNGTHYFLDSEANELYQAVSDEEVGELVGSIKKIKVRGNQYYRETIDNTFHTINSDGNFEYMGKIVKGRAVFKK